MFTSRRYEFVLYCIVKAEKEKKERKKEPLVIKLLYIPVSKTFIIIKFLYLIIILPLSVCPAVCVDLTLVKTRGTRLAVPFQRQKFVLHTFIHSFIHSYRPHSSDRTSTHVYRITALVQQQNDFLTVLVPTDHHESNLG